MKFIISPYTKHTTRKSSSIGGVAMLMKAADGYSVIAKRYYIPDFSPIGLQTEFSFIFEIKKSIHDEWHIDTY